MIPKIGGMADAIYEGVHEAVIIDGRVPHSILLELFSNRGSGTRLPPQPPRIKRLRHCSAEAIKGRAYSAAVRRLAYCRCSYFSGLALSVILRDAETFRHLRKGGALGSPHKLYLFAKASPFGRGVTAGDGEGEDADRVQRCSERQPQGFAQQLHFTGGTPIDSEKVIKRDGEYVLHTYNRNPIVLEKGHGLCAIGPEGQQYLDFTSGIGVNSLGYCDLDGQAVSQQAHNAALLQPVLHGTLRRWRKSCASAPA